jgi:AraC-like DNA-binding protein
MDAIEFLIHILLFYSALQGMAIGIFMFFRARGNRLANVSLGFLLFTFGLSALDVWLLRIHWFENVLHLYHYPLWYTLSFGPLFFYHVKFSLFPIYRFRPSDFKHLVLPVIQFVFVFSIALQAPEHQYQIWQEFIRPYYGPMEYALFLVFFFIYISLAYRYVRYQNARLRHQGKDWEIKKAFLLRKTIKRLTILGTLYSLFAIWDFVAFRFWDKNLYEVPGFSFFGDIAFSGMLLWLGYAVFREDFHLWLHTRKLPPPSDAQALVQQLKSSLLSTAALNNPELGFLHLAKTADCPGQVIRTSVHQYEQKSVLHWIQYLRISRIKDKITSTSDLHEIAILTGFSSKEQMLRALKRELD